MYESASIFCVLFSEYLDVLPETENAPMPLNCSPIVVRLSEVNLELFRLFSSFESISLSRCNSILFESIT